VVETQESKRRQVGEKKYDQKEKEVVDAAASKARPMIDFLNTE
jgi:hypothetical protein